MRRRTREHAADAPPLPLTRYRGSTNREAMAWLEARNVWWSEARDPDDGGWLPWLLDGHEQVGELPWCGSIAAPCADDDCMCAVWPEHLEQEADTIPTLSVRRVSTERNTR